MIYIGIFIAPASMRSMVVRGGIASGLTGQIYMCCVPPMAATAKPPKKAAN